MWTALALGRASSEELHNEIADPIGRAAIVPGRTRFMDNRHVKVAAIQLEPVIGDVDANLVSCERLAEEERARRKAERLRKRSETAARRMEAKMEAGRVIFREHPEGLTRDEFVERLRQRVPGRAGHTALLLVQMGEVVRSEEREPVEGHTQPSHRFRLKG